MLMDHFSAKTRLFQYIDSLLKGDVDISAFVSSYEHIYNFELERSSLSEAEAKALDRLFEKVVWYSPFPEERKTIANYIDEAAVIDEARSVIEMLRYCGRTGVDS